MDFRESFIDIMPEELINQFPKAAKLIIDRVVALNQKAVAKQSRKAYAEAANTYMLTGEKERTRKAVVEALEGLKSGEPLTLATIDGIPYYEAAGVERVFKDIDQAIEEVGKELEK